MNLEYNRYSDIFKEYYKEEKYFLNVAVVGSFSCGKSSFINSLIEEDIEPVDITPVNHANSIFTYSEKMSIKSGVENFTLEEYLNEVKKVDSKYKEFLIKYPCEALKYLKLYDTPGFGSVNIAESNNSASDIKLSKKAAENAETIFYLVDLTNGTIDEPSLKYLKDINENKNLYIILTHADKKSLKARVRIKEEILKQVRGLGIDDERIFLYSSCLEKCNENDKQYFNESKRIVKELINGLGKKREVILQGEKAIKDFENKIEEIKTFALNELEKDKNNNIFNTIVKVKVEIDKIIAMIIDEFFQQYFSKIVEQSINFNYKVNKHLIKNTYSITYRLPSCFNIKVLNEKINSIIERHKLYINCNKVSEELIAHIYNSYLEFCLSSIVVNADKSDNSDEYILKNNNWYPIFTESIAKNTIVKLKDKIKKIYHTKLKELKENSTETINKHFEEARTKKIEEITKILENEYKKKKKNIINI